jgi:hypothetical protein
LKSVALNREKVGGYVFFKQLAASGQPSAKIFEKSQFINLLNFNKRQKLKAES